MAAAAPVPARARSFSSEAAFDAWLTEHHDSEPELWVKVHKKGSGLPSVTWREIVEVCLRWGWIDSTRRSLDERSFLQRITPRRPKSSWSQVNREHVERMVTQGRMTPHGLAHVEAAKRDGRWDEAYAPQRSTELPSELVAAISANAAAAATLARLDRANLFSLAFRVRRMKTDAGRERKIAQLVQLLAEGEAPLGEPRPRRNSRTLPR